MPPEALRTRALPWESHNLSSALPCEEHRASNRCLKHRRRSGEPAEWDGTVTRRGGLIF